jgi:hypothetical protein
MVENFTPSHTSGSEIATTTIRRRSPPRRSIERPLWTSVEPESHTPSRATSEPATSVPSASVASGIEIIAKPKPTWN